MRGSPGCGGTSGRRARTSARSRSTTTTTPSSSSTRWPSGARKRSGTTCARTTSRLTPCMRAATPPSAARRARVRSRRGSRRVPGAGGGRAVRPRSAASTARSRRADSSTSCTRSWAATPMSETAVALKGEAVEVALAEATAVLAMVQDEDRRGRLADLIAAIEDGEVEGESAQALEELLELGLQTGRLRALYGPAGEQAALKTYRKLPGGKDLAESAREVSRALSALAGSTLEQVSLSAVGPGAYTLNLVVEGRELSIRLDRSGARINSIVA